MRGHDQDVLGEERRIRFKKSQQSILKHLDFSHRAVAGVDLNGGVSFADRLLFIRAAPPVHEIQNIGLNVFEEAVIARSFKGFMLLTAKSGDEIKEIPAQRPHRGQQAIPFFKVKFLRQSFFLFLPSRKPLHLPPRDNIGPVFPAGVHKKQVDLDVLRYGG